MRETQPERVEWLGPLARHVPKERARYLSGSRLSEGSRPAKVRTSARGTSSVPAAPPKAYTPSPDNVVARLDWAAMERRPHHRRPAQSA